MARKGIFGLFGSKEEKEEPKVVEEIRKVPPRKLAGVDPNKARAEARRARPVKRRPVKKEKVVKKHVVVSGDTLSGIAKKYYDDAGKYMVIYKANKEIIGDNPDLIKPGMDLVIPEL